MIEATGISKSYGNLKVLNSIDIAVKRSEIVSIVGASGAGKTTLLQILGTLDKADTGQLKLAGNVIGKLNGNKLALFRNKNIGFIFQFHYLLPEFTALENTCMPALISGSSMEKCSQRGMELLSLLGIENRSTHKPGELSGGEQQRVAVARALMNEPAVVLADEPSGNLDSANADELHHLFFLLREKLGQTFVIVTHNEGFAEMADRKLIMRDGQFVTQ
ncbi:MAG TPA: ABC transporter ATP-binding protein [Bacteroidia bacterium]|nr:ABC transporter ATP-binding protein [Bacteroidia bacterium]